MGTYFVTGVSGSLGSRLITQLAKDPQTTHIIGIDRRPLKVSASKLEYIQRDIDIDIDIDIAGAGAGAGDVLDGVDTLVHLAPFSPAGLKELLKAAAAANVKSVVALSSAAVFGSWPTNAVPLTEESPIRPNPGFAFAVELAESERILQEFKQTHPEISVAVLRLAMILGGGFDKALMGVLGGVTAHRHLESSRPVQFLHIDDAISAITIASVDQLDGVFNVAPDGFVADAHARAVAGAAPRPGLPRRVAYIANDLVWRSRKRVDFAAASLYLEHPWVLSNDRLRAAGWKPSYSTQEALVAEATPTLWGRLRPGQRRALVTGGIVAGSSASTLGTIAVVAEFLRRKRRSRS